MCLQDHAICRAENKPEEQEQILGDYCSPGGMEVTCATTIEAEEMTYLREIWEAKSTELCDRLDLGGEGSGKQHQQ